MAQRNNKLEEAVDVSPTPRRVTPPPQDQLNEPDTSVQVMNAPVVEQRDAKPPEKAFYAPKLEEAVDVGNEQVFAVKPSATFDTYIGNNHWYFQKDVTTHVPASVRDILARAKKIYP